MTTIELLKVWRDHIRDVYERRGRETVYQPLEVMHTCHGCGCGSGPINDGLCLSCEKAYHELVQKDRIPAPPGTVNTTTKYNDRWSSFVVE